MSDVCCCCQLTALQATLAAPRVAWTSRRPPGAAAEAAGVSVGVRCRVCPSLSGDALLLCACTCAPSSPLSLFLHSAFVPSVEATSQELLQWLLDYASTSDKKDIKAAAKRAATIGAAFRLTGGTLRSLPVASLIKFGAGGDTELADAWELLQLRWKAAVDGNASRPLLFNPVGIVP